MISHKLTMIPGLGRTGFGRDEIYPETILFGSAGFLNHAPPNGVVRLAVFCAGSGHTGHRSWGKKMGK